MKKGLWLALVVSVVMVTSIGTVHAKLVPSIEGGKFIVRKVKELPKPPIVLEANRPPEGVSLPDALALSQREKAEVIVKQPQEFQPVFDLLVIKALPVETVVRFQDGKFISKPTEGSADVSGTIVTTLLVLLLPILAVLVFTAKYYNHPWLLAVLFASLFVGYVVMRLGFQWWAALGMGIGATAAVGYLLVKGAPLAGICCGALMGFLVQGGMLSVNNPKPCAVFWAIIVLLQIPFALFCKRLEKQRKQTRRTPCRGPVGC